MSQQKNVVRVGFRLTYLYPPSKKTMTKRRDEVIHYELDFGNYESQPTPKVFDKPFNCPFCKMAFRMKENITYHVIRYHPEKVPLLVKRRKRSASLPCSSTSDSYSDESSVQVDEREDVSQDGNSKRKQHDTPETTTESFTNNSTVTLFDIGKTDPPKILSNDRVSLLPKARMQVHDNPKPLPMGQQILPSKRGTRLRKASVKMIDIAKTLPIKRKFQSRSSVIKSARKSRNNQAARKKPKLHGKQVSPEARIWKCNLCSKILASNTSLIRHVQLVHEGLQPHSCYFCGMKFGLQFTLCTHMKRIHFHEHESEKNRKIMKCDVCSKFFATNFTLKRHSAMIHENLMPFRCYFCDNTFSLKDSMFIHLRKHHFYET